MGLITQFWMNMLNRDSPWASFWYENQGIPGDIWDIMAPGNWFAFLISCNSPGWGFNYWNVFAEQTYHFNCWGMFLFIVVLQVGTSSNVNVIRKRLDSPHPSGLMGLRGSTLQQVLNWGMIISASMRSTLQASMETNEAGGGSKRSGSYKNPETSLAKWGWVNSYWFRTRMRMHIHDTHLFRCEHRRYQGCDQQPHGPWTGDICDDLPLLCTFRSFSSPWTIFGGQRRVCMWLSRSISTPSPKQRRPGRVENPPGEWQGGSHFVAFVKGLPALPFLWCRRDLWASLWI